jgi:hypothetical protein
VPSGRGHIQLVEVRTARRGREEEEEVSPQQFYLLRYSRFSDVSEDIIASTLRQEE